MTSEEMAIQEAAEQIINARDFCGHEREAAADALYDCGVTVTKDRIAQAFSIANDYWRQAQRSAGVKKPITAGERKAIYRTLEEG
jgi:hypothetical protein